MLAINMLDIRGRNIDLPHVRRGMLAKVHLLDCRVVAWLSPLGLMAT